MRASQKLAGYSLEEADNLRKATGKKIRELIAKERVKFVDGCVHNGHSKQFAEKYFDTIGVFQLEGGPMRALLRSMAPDTFEDVSAVLALYRPGPMAQNWHNEYADRKNGRRPVSFDHPDLEEILGPTFGLMIYQEQLMRVSQKLAGYSLEEADNLRKATGKKIRALIAKERSKFVDGCLRNGHSKEFAERYFDKIEPFADYSFNKSHTVGYGYITYQTAWLKANYPVQYLAALLTSVKTNLDKAAVYLNECRQLDIPVLVPDVNASASDFACEARRGDRVDAIRFGLSAVRNVGEGVAGLLIEERGRGGPFSGFHDFCERVDPAVLNKRTVESLINGGAFDSLGHSRKGLLMVFENIIEVALRRRRERIVYRHGPLGRRRRKRHFRLRRRGQFGRAGLRQE